MILLILLAYWLTRPRRVKETLDADTFVDALAARSEQIFRRCQSPREVRRFLNYLRLIATQPSMGTGKQALTLRAKFPEKFDANLVDLASMGYMPMAGPEGPEIEQYFNDQCHLFGLDPETFMSKETTATNR